jgi:methyl-accepting chemotaxis protein
MNYLPIIVGVMAAAVVIQIGVLLALFVAVRRGSSRMQVLAVELKTNVMPIAENVKAIVAELKPKIATVATDVRETTSIVREQIERVDAAIGEITARTHLQVIRVQELLDRTKDHINETSELVNQVVLPARRLSGLLRGATAGLGFLIQGKRRRSY